MKIHSSQPLKSLGAIHAELPDLTIITGINGSGKTQLLQGIASGHIEVALDAMSGIMPVSAIRYTGSDSLFTQSTNVYSVQSKYTTAGMRSVISTFAKYKKTVEGSPSLRANNAFLSGDNERDVATTIDKIADLLDKKVPELTNEDVYEYYSLLAGSLFNVNISIVFKAYNDRLEENSYKEYRSKSKHDESAHFLEKKEFEKAYGPPPWEVFNRILDESGLDYQVNSPLNNSRDSPFSILLKTKKKNLTIDFTDLSSGEKILMSLVFALYSASREVEFPQLLLLDEFDASLHPLMSQQLLSVIENVLVKEKGVKVIMTTHSPSTVALAPEDSLFVMNKQVDNVTGKRIEKTSKDKALAILTAGVPTLSIGYENRRQVFVESRIDVAVYESLYQKLRSYLVQGISLNFISSGVGGKGNCDEVKEVVNKLSSFGNKTVFGIIDWDLRNHGNKWVKVLGKNLRYSIENYILDPVLLAALLVWGKYSDKKLIKILDREMLSDFRSFKGKKLQDISDAVVAKVKANLDNTDTEDVLLVEYISGATINIPEWYLHCPGHDLEKAIKIAFPALGRYTKEDALKSEILSKVIDDLPELIPKDFLSLFASIQNSTLE